LPGMDCKEYLEVERLKSASRVVVKIGTASLTYDTGRLNIGRIERLSAVLSDMCNMCKELILVSSGAVSAGVAKLGLAERPDSVSGRQACAAVGQAELMQLYERVFAPYGRKIAQVLLTRDVISDPQRRANAEATFGTLLGYGCLPIVNENDTVSSDEIRFSGNDILSAYVACLCKADLLVNFTDFDGMYDADPRKNPDARKIRHIPEVTERELAFAGDAGSERGTGGMFAKLEAARIAAECGVPMVICAGADPAILRDILDGRVTGTYIGPL